MHSRFGRSKIQLCLVFTALLLMFAGQNLFAAKQSDAVAPVLIKAEIDARELNIGDPFHYILTVQGPQDMQIEPHGEKGEAFGKFFIKDYERKDRTDKRNRTRKIILRYALAAFETGELTIPAYTLVCRIPGQAKKEEIKSDSVKVTVKSVIVEKTDQNNPDIKPLKPKIVRWQNYLLWLLVAAAVVPAAFLLIKRLRQKARPAAAPPLPAHVIAYQELERLQKEGLIARGLIEEYFEKLSGCIRRYLENRFHLRAPWMSTEEFLEAAKRSPLLSAPQKQLLKSFLTLCDLVKFARYSSSPVEADESFNAAKDFVGQTKEPEEERKNGI
ncbi:MAG: BatD family protein [Candidatus Omnitrophica bacterium]|nr:BatD family protein [Candidatus Omnitrophota bacterium]MBU4479707.1 BatD family protein [Candidatus Omnitrophota bacterium]MCG2703503.1 BatD family protein [Candidatus Omnitrophota bacterium]